MDEGVVFPHQRRHLQGASQAGSDRSGRTAEPASSRPSGQPSFVGVLPPRRPHEVRLPLTSAFPAWGIEKAQGRGSWTDVSYSVFPKAPLPTALTPHQLHGAKVTQGCKGGWERWWLGGAGSGGKEEGTGGPCPFTLWFPKTPPVDTRTVAPPD